MDNVKELILKILKYKSDDSIDEVKVDLQRVYDEKFEYTEEDIGYVKYLFKHYEYEINIIRQMMFSTGISMMNSKYISLVEEIQHYLIKIAIIRVCNKKMIEYHIENMNDLNYCNRLIDDLCN